ncbi:MAG: sulfite exporter TauE/SafE family protein [Ruminococcaceae bacterium]|nr:sulfite exporter TauE/SafE family protein [Oscillospiraceae bacterium]
MEWLIYILTGLSAGVVTGLAGLSASVVVTPVLVSISGWESYDAVTVALAADIFSCLLSSYTYGKNKNIDLGRGLMIGVTALAGTIAGSYFGYLFSQAQPNGLGYIAMVTTVLLGVKFLVKPVNGGLDAKGFAEQQGMGYKTFLAVFCGLFIGFVCGFTGSGGGILMLTVFTLLLGYNLKVAVGTSTLIMTFVALVGTISHITMGAHVELRSILAVVIASIIGALAAARFANKSDVKKLNCIIGFILLALGVLTTVIKMLA